MRAKIHFIANGVFSTSIAGGDFHFLELAKAVAHDGYEVNFFGGHALQEVLAQCKIPGTVTFTDDAPMAKVNQGSLGGQLDMFRDFYRRYRLTRQLLGGIAPEDFVYAVSDYWFDVVPAARCAARRKLMILHMWAPSVVQALRRARPAALHYSVSQKFSLQLFRSGGSRSLLYIHPNMKQVLLRRGFGERNIHYISAGCDVKIAGQVPEQPKQFDVVWIGRVHPQKGTDDLLATLSFLAGKLPDFRAVLIGRLNELQSQLETLGLLNHVTVVASVTEVEKFRLLKASRLFLMPSRYEGSGSSVIREALVSGIAVVAYELEVYRPVFGDLIRYVPPFDLRAFQEMSLDTLVRARAGQIQPDAVTLTALKQTCSWEAVGERFVEILSRETV
jgi:glycosyltransferase involved in cell wall biosynthesis